jgi:ubiquinone/menaquinone biosynthesis C-methylase UbiE
MDERGAYIHGTSSDEQHRLSRMNDLINAACLQAMRLGGEQRVLDVGSGLGQFTRRLARELGPAARVVGVEASAVQLAEARRLAAEADEADLVEFRQGRAEDPPLEDGEEGAFDLAHARFLLEHHRRPEAVVAAMVRAVRPGGRVVLLDDDHDTLRAFPEPPSTMALWRAYIRSYDRLGCDPFVGRRLPSLLHAGGARPLRIALVPYGACAGQPEFAALVENLARAMESARDLMLEQQLAAERDFSAMRAELRDWARRPEAALWYAISYAEGAAG